jgi:cytochrome c oxidase cbb3-type subunit 1
VPAWVPSIAIVSCSLLTFHYVMTFLNLRAAFSGGGFALKFIAFGILCYVFGGLLDAATAIRGVAKIVQFTFFTQAQNQLALYGAVSMLFLGAIYYLVPRVSGNVWNSAALARGHFGLVVLGVVLLVVGLAGAGWIQGHELNESTASFTVVAEHTKSWLLVATAAQAVLLLASLVLGVNFLRTACFKGNVSSVQLLRQPAVMEAHVS